MDINHSEKIGHCERPELITRLLSVSGGGEAVRAINHSLPPLRWSERQSRTELLIRGLGKN